MGHPDIVWSPTLGTTPTPRYVFPGTRASAGMNRLLVAGLAFVALGLVGYAVGVVTAYPGRSFAVTAIMVGVTLIAVRAADAEVTP